MIILDTMAARGRLSVPLSAAILLDLGLILKAYGEGRLIRPIIGHQILLKFLMRFL